METSPLWMEIPHPGHYLTSYRKRFFLSDRKRGVAGAVPHRTGDIYQGFNTAKFLSHKDLIMQGEIREFLESITSHNTRKGYLRAFSLFEEGSGKFERNTVTIVYVHPKKDHSFKWKP